MSGEGVLQPVRWPRRRTVAEQREIAARQPAFSRHLETRADPAHHDEEGS